MLSRLVFLLGIAALGIGSASAAPVVSVGSGSAVATVDRSATFDGVVTGTDLTNYTEGGLRIAVNNFAYVDFDPSNGNGGGFSGGFHYPNSGATNHTSISTADGREIRGLEFNVGDGWGAGANTAVNWMIFHDGVLVDFGVRTVASGSVIGFSDVDGFDELLISDRRGTNLNAIALDNLVVELVPSGDGAVPEPNVALLAGLGLLALGLRRRRSC